MGSATLALRVGRRRDFLQSARKDGDAEPPRGEPCKPRCGGIVTDAAKTPHMPEYFGPPPPSGGTQVMLWLGSLMSQVLQWTQFCALITNRGLPPSSTHS